MNAVCFRSWAFPGGLVEESVPSVQGVWVLSLVRTLRSCKLRSTVMKP